MTSLQLLPNLAVDVDGILVGRERLVDVSTDELTGRAVVECLGARRVHVLHTYTITIPRTRDVRANGIELNRVDCMGTAIMVDVLTKKYSVFIQYLIQEYATNAHNIT